MASDSYPIPLWSSSRVIAVMRGAVVIVDYGMGNVHSVRRKIARLGVDCSLSSAPGDLLAADKLILPGVGHFARAMANLASRRLLEPLREAVLQKKTPILGICLGLQLMSRKSEEGAAAGLGWLDADVIRFGISDTRLYKVPHVGWNGVSVAKRSSLMRGVPDLAEFYFTHAYHLASVPQEDVLNTTEYEYPFVSAVEKDNIFGVQYHPEKSHDVGNQLLRNFVEL